MSLFDDIFGKSRELPFPDSALLSEAEYLASLEADQELNDSCFGWDEVEHLRNDVGFLIDQFLSSFEKDRFKDEQSIALQQLYDLNKIIPRFIRFEFIHDDNYQQRISLISYFSMHGKTEILRDLLSINPQPISAFDLFVSADFGKGQSLKFLWNLIPENNKKKTYLDAISIHARTAKFNPLSSFVLLFNLDNVYKKSINKKQGGMTLLNYMDALSKEVRKIDDLNKSRIKELLKLSSIYGVDEMVDDNPTIKKKLDTLKQLVNPELASKNALQKPTGAKAMLEKHKAFKAFTLTTETQKRETRELFSFVEQGKNLKIPVYIDSQKFEKVRELKASFPNFDEVIDYILEGLVLQMHGIGYAYFEPLLLVGKPGIGKTEFLNRLGAILNVNSYYLNVGSMSANFTLAGGDKTWRDAKPGKIANLLINDESPNFILHLDEIDKVIGNNGNGGSPLSVLYELLENKTARKFIDSYYEEDVHFDASLINFIAAANDIRKVPEPLISRFNVFEVKPPTAEQLIPVIQNIHTGLLKQFNLEDKINIKLSDEVYDCLVNQSPREIKKLMKRAYSKVLVSNKTSLSAADFEDFIQSQIPDNGIGFTAVIH